MEIHAILSSGVTVPTKEGWEAALVDLQLAVVFHPDFEPDHARGFCPMTIAGKKAGCEVDFNLETVESLREDNPDLDWPETDAGVFSFRFGGDMREGACAYAAAAALIGAYEAVLYDSMDGTLTREPGKPVATAKEFLTLDE